MTPPKQAKDDPTSAKPEEANNLQQDNAPDEGRMPAETAPENQQQEEIDRLRDELAKMRDQWVRAVAETDNLRKRSQRELEETSRYAVTNFARDMVSVLENLKRASESIPAQTRAGNELLKTLGEGVDLTLQELLNTFERYGIRRIDPLNQKFDPNLHQAVVQVENADVPPGTVVQVVQAGYTLHDRLLRPAMVAVSKAPNVDAPKQVDTTA